MPPKKKKAAAAKTPKADKPAGADPNEETKEVRTQIFSLINLGSQNEPTLIRLDKRESKFYT
jgi:hypothetical protein